MPGYSVKKLSSNNSRVWMYVDVKNFERMTWLNDTTNKAFFPYLNQYGNMGMMCNITLDDLPQNKQKYNYRYFEKDSNHNKDSIIPYKS